MRLPTSLVGGALHWVARPVLGPPVPVRVQRALGEVLMAPFGVPREVTVSPGTLGGRPSHRVAAPGATGPGAVLLLHGGAFVTGTFTWHRALAAQLSLGSGLPVHVLDYRLAPEHPYPAALDDAEAAFLELAEHAHVAVAGDSAGGALALMLALRRRDAGGPQPTGLALLSPLVDLTGDHSRDFRGDPLLRADWARWGVQAFLGGADARALSPLTADLTGLPPVIVHAVERERLRAEADLLVEALGAAGVDVESEVLPGLWHDVHLHAGTVREATEATARVASWLRRRVPAALD